MKSKEANIIIAKYMGVYIHGGSVVKSLKLDEIVYHSDLYSDSLDALVPVWDKLCIDGGWFNINRLGLKHYQLAIIHGQDASGDFPYEEAATDNIQEAAAISTAKLILRLARELL